VTRPSELASDLEPGAPDDVIRLADRLHADCPLPDPVFRGHLRRQLEARGTALRRPERLRALIAGYAGSGSLLLLVGAISAGGVGPLGG
jgi:hypothetical protein